MKIIVLRDVKFLHTESPKENTYKDFYPESVENNEEIDISKNHNHDMIDVILKPSENRPNETVEENIAEVFAERIKPANGDAVEEFQENQDDPPQDAQEAIRRAPGRPRIVRTGERERPRKEFHYHQARILQGQSAHLSEILMRKVMSGLEADEWRLAMVKKIRSIIETIPGN